MAARGQFNRELKSNLVDSFEFRRAGVVQLEMLEGGIAEG
jgi:hypothetical protein